MTEIKYASDIGVDVPEAPKCKANIAIKFDDGESMVVEIRGRNGLIRDQDGDAHQLRRLGGEGIYPRQSLWKCIRCESEFASKRSLRGQTSSRRCHTWQDMSETEQRRHRQTRKTAQARQGRRPCKIELREVFTCTGEKTA